MLLSCPNHHLIRDQNRTKLGPTQEFSVQVHSVPFFCLSLCFSGCGRRRCPSPVLRRLSHMFVGVSQEALLCSGCIRNVLSTWTAPMADLGVRSTRPTANSSQLFQSSRPWSVGHVVPRDKSTRPL